MSRAKDLLRAIATAYQIAGPLLIAPDVLSEGQRERLSTLLLDFLASPDNYTAKTLRSLYYEAMKP